MGIRFICPSCDKKLNVKSYLAGKRGICPDCSTRIRIPSEDSSDSQSCQVAQRAEDKPRVPLTLERCLAEKPEMNWYIRPASGGEFGPADNELLKTWIGENRVGSDTQLRRDDWINWKNVPDIFIDFSPADLTPGDSNPAVNSGKTASETQSISSTAVLEQPEEPDLDLGNEDFLAVLEYQNESAATDGTFANLEIDNSTMSQRNLQSRDSSKNKMYTGIVLGILSVVLLGSLVAVVVMTSK